MKTMAYMVRARVVASVIAFALTATASAQVGDSIQIEHSCSYYGEALPDSVVTFESDSQARDVIQRIVNASGLVQNFEIHAAGIPNAAAVIRGGKRFILYSQYFVRETKEKTGNEWAPISILAHEIGHHLNGHTIEAGGSRPKTELEADYYSGFVLQKMGAKMSDARVAMESLGSATGSATHPAKNDRLAAIASGWEKGCASDARCGSMAPERPPASEPKPEKERAASLNSCEYARDGTCDEPDLCEPGTDTTDCRARPKPVRPDQRPPQASFPNYCCTAVGKLGPYPNPGPNGVAVPEGGSCFGSHPFYGVQYGQACR